MTRIAVDAMGGDNAPDAVITGAVKALDRIEEGTEILLIGNKDIINSRVKELYGKNSIEEISNKIKIKCLVSKGTYIRSLIRDIGTS